MRHLLLSAAWLLCSACSAPLFHTPDSPAPALDRVVVSGQVVARAEGASLTPVEVLVIDPPKRYQIADKTMIRRLLGLIGSKARISGVVKESETDGNSYVLEDVRLEAIEPRPIALGVEAHV